ncbi:MAG: alpha/beta fold hydrolase [Sphingobacterium sp.]
MLKFMLSFLVWSLIIVLFLLFAGVLFEQYSRWSLERTAFKGKTFVEINGKPLHYVKRGEGNGTVVFQSGMGSSHRIWGDIQDSISKHAVTISYDRNGLMLSEDTGIPVTNDQISRELQILLEKTNCPKPYILVGHSMAGVYLRPFIKQNENDIQGIILAESANPKLAKEASQELLKALSIPPDWLIKFVVSTGIYRAVFSFIPISKEIPFTHPLHRQERDFFYRSYHKVLEELKNENLNFKDAEKYPSFGNTPLTVIMGTSEVRYAGIKTPSIRDEFRQLVKEGQRELLTLSSDSQLVRADHSGHVLQINDNEILIKEINKMLELNK